MMADIIVSILGSGPCTADEIRAKARRNPEFYPLALLTRSGVYRLVEELVTSGRVQKTMVLADSMHLHVYHLPDACFEKPEP